MRESAGNLFYGLKQTLKYHLARRRFRTGNWIFGRHACLGADVLALMNANPPVFNVQKGRVDYLMRCVENPNYHARASRLAPFMERKDIIPLISQEERFASRPKRAPSLVYMDSFSELTDQLFQHRSERWGVCCNYTDIRHSEQFRNEFESVGLMPPESLEQCYRRFFDYIRQEYGAVPILYLHFPIKLDIRERFVARYDRILTTISKLEREYQPFFSIAIDQTIVDWPEEVAPGLEGFPYHYNKATYLAFADEIRKTGTFAHMYRT